MTYLLADHAFRTSGSDDAYLGTCSCNMSAPLYSFDDHRKHVEMIVAAQDARLTTALEQAAKLRAIVVTVEEYAWRMYDGAEGGDAPDAIHADSIFRILAGEWDATREHHLRVRGPLSYPGGKNGMYEVKCSCQRYVSSPGASASDKRMWQAALAHKQAKEAERDEPAESPRHGGGRPPRPDEDAPAAPVEGPPSAAGPGGGPEG